MDRVNVVYPPKTFALSAADAVSLENLADQLVAETLRTHDDFISQGRVVDPTRWKVVKEKHNMTAYRTRKRTSTRFRRDRVPSDETEAVAASPQMPSFYPVMDKKMEHALSETYPSVTFLEADSEDELEHEFSYVDVLEQNVLEKTRPERAPMVFCAGVVPGTVEDAALGFFADTEQQSRLRNSSSKEVVVDDTRILARLQGPTQDDPFRFLGGFQTLDLNMLSSKPSQVKPIRLLLEIGLEADESPADSKLLAARNSSSLVNLLLRIKVMESRGVVYPPTPLQLSPEDERTIEMIADRLVAETLHASEDFAVHRHVADPSSWKRIKEKGNIVAYQDISNLRSTKRERVWSEDTVVVAASPQNPTFYPSNRSLEDEMFREGFHNIDDYDSGDESSLHHDDFTKFGAKPGAEISVLEKFRPANVPTVFSHGIFPGTVEDMAFAFLADTDERSRTRFNTNKDVVVEDMRILAQIHGPTKEDPFRFLGVKWCYSMPSRTVSLVVKPRDYLIIEATGMALDSNGERFTYLLNHSIELDQVPAFRDFGLVRTVFSACHIMKPYQNGEAVDAYARGFLHIGGSFSCTVRKMLPVQGARGRHMKKKEREFCLDCYLKAKRLPAWHVAVATLAKSSP
ncbi:hypothetical protein JG687_00009520 [Phytophthora cactorum]|uniref:START-like domain n=1 Tax=Phytophthora cactorum TaxID=29920 RepID=A0A8T1UDP8_9STRA|nr:hypothetical protein JG687_00009520 [Phytophthora cactorum]